MSWAGMMTVVFLEILRAVLSALCLMMKVKILFPNMGPFFIIGIKVKSVSLDKDMKEWSLFS